MCQIYANAARELYEHSSRSVRIQGCVSSIRLENEFWRILDEMAVNEGKSTPQFINVLYDEILQNHGKVQNFTSFLRVACTIYLLRRADSTAYVPA